MLQHPSLNKIFTLHPQAKSKLNIICQRIDTLSIKEMFARLNTSPFEAYQLVFYDMVHQDKEGLMHVILNSEDRVVIVADEFDAITKAVFDSFQLKNEYFSLGAIIPFISEDLCEMTNNGEPNLISVETFGTQIHLAQSSCDKIIVPHTKWSLGAIKQSLRGIEPSIRSLNTLNLNLQALKKSELPNHNFGNIAGLTVEELTQIMYFYGRSSKSRVLTISGWQMEMTPYDFIALLLWYFIYGISLQNPIQAMTGPRFQHYKIDMLEESLPELTFIKDQLENSWWFMIPESLHNLLSAYQYIPCSYEDYSSASDSGILSPSLQQIFDFLLLKNQSLKS